MILVDVGVLPRKVTPQNAPQLAGETAYWFCSTCKKWRTSIIQADGTITCSVCGNRPDNKHTPLLAYRSRYRIVNELCAPGSEWRKQHDALIKRYANFIDATWRGLPARAKQSGYRYFSTAWREIDGLGDYLLSAPDGPGVDVPRAYSEGGLKRRYYRPNRKCNVMSMSDLQLPYMTDDGGRPYTDEEVAETLSFQAGFLTPSYDHTFENDFLEHIKDEKERSIARDLAMGMTKRDIQRTHGLSEGQVRTIVRHMAKQLNNAQR